MATRPPRGATRGAVAVAGVVAWTALLLALTLRPAGATVAARWVLAGPEAVVADGIANIAVFMPFGAFLAAAGLTRRRAVGAALVLSALIEVSQGLGIPGRYASLTDVVTNGLGALLGVVLYADARRLTRPTRREARALVMVGTAVVAGVLLGTRWLQAPGSPSAAFEGQHAQDWRPARDSMHTVVRATFNDRTFMWALLDDAAFFNAALAARRMRLELLADPGALPAGRRRLAAVIEHTRPLRMLVRLESEAGDLRFSSRVRAEAWGLHAPFVRLPDALAPVRPTGAPRQLVRLGGARALDELTVWAADARGERTARQALTVLDGWQFVVPPPVSIRLGGTMWRLLVAGVLFGPLLWWLGWAVRPAPERADSRTA